jgi:radical SAM protein with 4Fe4S-binding SPASM domain
MTYETAEKVAEYIMEVAPKDKQINLSWFGGEPLYNMDVIEIICSRLASAGYYFKSTMISNSYLFDDETVRKARYEWRLTNVQVTFDGTEEIYNKIKNYIYKDEESPYQKVINNVRRLLRENITVSVRMNCDSHNAENLKELIKELDNEFKGEGNFSMYVWPLFEIGFKRSSEEKEILYKSVLELEQLLLDLGYPMGHALPDGIKGTHCMVDTGDTVTISPRGDLGICEHYVDKDFVSHIDNPYEKDFNIIKSWRNYVPVSDYCKDCPVYPVCLKMKGCPDEVPCEEYQKNYWIEHYKLDMVGKYIMFKNNNSCEKPCGDNKCCNNQKN